MVQPSVWLAGVGLMVQKVDMAVMWRRGGQETVQCSAQLPRLVIARFLHHCVVQMFFGVMSNGYCGGDIFLGLASQVAGCWCRTKYL